MVPLLEFLKLFWLDLFMVFVFAYYAVDGYYRGFFRMCLDTAGFLLAFFMALLLYRLPAALIRYAFDLPYFFASAISLFIVWSAVDLLWPIAAKRIGKHFRSSEQDKTSLDKVLGIIPGFANGALLFSVLLTVLLAFPVPAAIKAQVNDSPIAGPLIAMTAAIDETLKPLFGEFGREGINLITVAPEAQDVLELHFTVHDGRVDHTAEQEMLKLVNAERRARGLSDMEWSNRLRDVGRLHSVDMFQKGYFGHVNREGLSPSDRVDLMGIPYGTTGENLALAPTVAVAHKGLMNSPGHRANILHESFKKIGIGVIDGGVYGKMFTQVFSD